MALYRHEAKTRNRYHLGASFDLGFTRIKRELEAPRPKNQFLVKIGFSLKIHLYHPKGGLHCKRAHHGAAFEDKRAWLGMKAKDPEEELLLKDYIRVFSQKNQILLKISFSAWGPLIPS